MDNSSLLQITPYIFLITPFLEKNPNPGQDTVSCFSTECLDTPLRRQTFCDRCLSDLSTMIISLSALCHNVYQLSALYHNVVQLSALYHNVVQLSAMYHNDYPLSAFYQIYALCHNVYPLSPFLSLSVSVICFGLWITLFISYLTCITMFINLFVLYHNVYCYKALG